MARDKYPFGKAGNYGAPIDTTGMDEEMKDTLIPKPRKPRKPVTPPKKKGR